PAVLLVDYHLGDHRENGIELAARLLRRYPGLAAVVITANHEAEIKRATREAGMYCLLKPLKPLRLRMLLATLLSKSYRGEPNERDWPGKNLNPPRPQSQSREPG
ncbi:MAG TPA: response regulator, partial [Halomonas sp.]|nr:response regulator [Halomonas sp.]